MTLDTRDEFSSRGSLCSSLTGTKQTVSSTYQTGLNVEVAIKVQQTVHQVRVLELAMCRLLRQLGRQVHRGFPFLTTDTTKRDHQR